MIKRAKYATHLNESNKNVDVSDMTHYKDETFDNLVCNSHIKSSTTDQNGHEPTLLNEALQFELIKSEKYYQPSFNPHQYILSTSTNFIPTQQSSSIRSNSNFNLYNLASLTQSYMCAQPNDSLLRPTMENQLQYHQHLHEQEQHEHHHHHHQQQQRNNLSSSDNQNATNEYSGTMFHNFSKSANLTEIQQQFQKQFSSDLSSSSLSSSSSSNCFDLSASLHPYLMLSNPNRNDQPVNNATSTLAMSNVEADYNTITNYMNAKEMTNLSALQDQYRQSDHNPLHHFSTSYNPLTELASMTAGSSNDHELVDSSNAAKSYSHLNLMSCAEPNKTLWTNAAMYQNIPISTEVNPHTVNNYLSSLCSSLSPTSFQSATLDTQSNMQQAPPIVHSLSPSKSTNSESIATAKPHCLTNLYQKNVYNYSNYYVDKFVSAKSNKLSPKLTDGFATTSSLKHQQTPSDATKCVKLENKYSRIFVWDLDETLIIFHTLLTGYYVHRYGKDSTLAGAYGLRMEEFIYNLADNHLFFNELEECDQVHIDDIRGDERINSDLDNYVNNSNELLQSQIQTESDEVRSESRFSHDANGCFDSNGVTSSSVDECVSKANTPSSIRHSVGVGSNAGVGTNADLINNLAYHYKRIREIYNTYRHDVGSLLGPSKANQWIELRGNLDYLTNHWHSLALKATEKVANREDSLNVLVTTTQFIPSLAKILLYGYGPSFQIENIYSATKVGKENCFERIMSRFGRKSTYVVIGDGKEEEEASKPLNWPFWRISEHSDLMALNHALDLGYL